MKKNNLYFQPVIILLVFLFTHINFAQVEDNQNDNFLTSIGAQNIDSVINLVTTESVGSLTKEITGYKETTIGGSPYSLETRYSYTPSNKKAAQYIYEKLNSYGVTASYDNYGNNATNVIGKKTGSLYPNQMYIVCCHFDDVPSVTESKNAPGADDNGSGVVGILETARLLANYDLKYTVLFIAFDEEEIDILGSNAYALNASNRKDSILGVINLDMIAYYKNNDGKFEVLTNANSQAFSEEYIAAVRSHIPGLKPVKDVSEKGSSDHISFWKNGWKAIHVFEDSEEQNPKMHSPEDNFDNCNMTYLQNIVKSVIAFVAVKANSD